jgi:hypothetical protein
MAAKKKSGKKATAAKKASRVRSIAADRAAAAVSKAKLNAAEDAAREIAGEPVVTPPLSGRYTKGAGDAS